MKRLKENKKLLMIIGVLVLVVIALGLTYAFFTYSKSGSTENSIKSGSITFWYDEENRQGNSIGIEDALPTSDVDGKAGTNAFNFRITSTTGTTIAVPYTITLRQKAGTDNIGSIVKVYLAKTSGYDAAVNTEEEVVTSLYSSLSDITKNGYSEKVLYRDFVPAGSSNYNQNYRLKMWVDNEADYSDGTLNNKTFTVMVNVYAEAHTTSSNANVTSVAINNATLTATQVDGIDTYETLLPVGTTSATLNVETEDEYANVTVTKTESDYTTSIGDSGAIQRLSVTQNITVNLTSGDNYFKVIVSSEDNSSTKELHFRIRIITPLSTMILNDNPTRYTNATLTTSSNNTQDPSGLYSMSVTDGFGGGSGITYYFRGNVNNNYVTFAEKEWRIIRINEDNTIRLILSSNTDTVYNNYFKTSENGLYYQGTDADNKVVNWYNENITGVNDNKVASGNYFCEAIKVTEDSRWGVDSAIASYYNNYIPDYSCRTDGNGKGLVNRKAALITYDEALRAGGYPEVGNQNYYLFNGRYSYTMSAVGYFRNTRYVWRIQSDDHSIRDSYVSATVGYRPVINLKADVGATKQVIDGKTYYVVD